MLLQLIISHDSKEKKTQRKHKRLQTSGSVNPTLTCRIQSETKPRQESMVESRAAALSHHRRLNHISCFEQRNRWPFSSYLTLAAAYSDADKTAGSRAKLREETGCNPHKLVSENKARWDKVSLRRRPNSD